MSNVKNPAWYGGGLACFLKPGANKGGIFYCDGVNGLDANDGLSPGNPKLTLTATLALCTSGNFDTIVILDYWQPAGETWPVNVNVENVNIVGAAFAGQSWAHMSPPADTAALNVTAQMVDISYLMPDGGGTSPGIQVSNTAMGVRIHHCQFGTQYAAQDGIRVVGDCPAGWYHDNQFGRFLTRSGIRFTGGGTRCRVISNEFTGVQDVNVYVNSAMYTVIRDNVFGLYRGTTVGEAIYILAGDTLSTVDGNRATAPGAGGPAACPYRDTSATGACWGLNYSGLAPTYPVVV